MTNQEQKEQEQEEDCTLAHDYLFMLEADGTTLGENIFFK